MVREGFPNLTPGNHVVTSGKCDDYNCIAWAADRDVQRWWWPHEDGYWPEDAPLEPTLDAFIAAYGTLGFERCADGSFEAGFDKIALYANADGPQHAARQLPDGRWTSKLGHDEDIAHDTLEAVECDLYGRAVCFLRRRRSKPEKDCLLSAFQEDERGFVSLRLGADLRLPA